MIAVEIHNRPSSSDVSFDCALSVQTSAPPAPLPFGLGSFWSYLADGSDQGTAWRYLQFDDSNWAGGFGPLGYGESDQITTIPQSGLATYYFRRRIFLAQVTDITATVDYDDGVVVYLNGVEVSTWCVVRATLFFSVGFYLRSIVSTWVAGSLLTILIQLRDKAVKFHSRFRQLERSWEPTF